MVCLHAVNPTFISRTKKISTKFTSSACSACEKSYQFKSGSLPRSLCHSSIQSSCGPTGGQVPAATRWANQRGMAASSTVYSLLTDFRIKLG